MERYEDFSKQQSSIRYTQKMASSKHYYEEHPKDHQSKRRKRESNITPSIMAETRVPSIPSDMSSRSSSYIDEDVSYNNANRETLSMKIYLKIVY